MEKFYKRETAIIFIIPVIFEVATLIVLYDFVIKKYRLHLTIKRFSQNHLYFEKDQNRETLRIRSMINSFVIIILCLELVNNTLYIIVSILNIIWTNESTLLNTLLIPEHKIIVFNRSLRMAFVPLLSLLMNIIWLAYRKFTYKYTVIRWTAYIVVRVVGVYVLYLLQTGRDEYLMSISRTSLDAIIFTFLHFFDFFQFLYYSRKLYRHLKSKETEIRFFSFDKRAYLEIKSSRRHFKVATISVAIALFFFTLGFSLHFYIAVFQRIIPKIWHGVNLNSKVFLVMSIFTSIHSPFIVLYKLVFLLNYLFIASYVVRKSISDRKKLANINNTIKPIMEKYHKKLNLK